MQLIPDSWVNDMQAFNEYGRNLAQQNIAIQQSPRHELEASAVDNLHR